MVATAILLTIAVMLAIGFTLMGELKSLIPFKRTIWAVLAAMKKMEATLDAINVCAPTVHHIN